jgi:hypothetical protein
MFKVVDGDSGESIDVRELLGLTEEDFKNNPDLLNILQHMNKKAPVQKDEESKNEGTESGNAQKTRHFKNFDLLKKSVEGDDVMANPDG